MPVDEQIRHALGFAAIVEDRLGRQPTSVIDLGTGGGVPGLVLLSCWTEARVVLLDSNERRTEFLSETIDSWSAAPRGEVLRGRAEELGHQGDLRECFEVVTSRSFGIPALTAECGAAFLAPGGWMVVSEPPDVAPGTVGRLKACRLSASWRTGVFGSEVDSATNSSTSRPRWTADFPDGSASRSSAPCSDDRAQTTGPGSSGGGGSGGALLSAEMFHVEHLVSVSGRAHPVSGAGAELPFSGNRGIVTDAGLAPTHDRLWELQGVCASRPDRPGGRTRHRDGVVERRPRWSRCGAMGRVEGPGPAADLPAQRGWAGRACRRRPAGPGRAPMTGPFVGPFG